jgi:pyruvate,water dikinase
LWIRLSDVVRHPIGRHLALQILRAVEPGTRNALLPLLREPELGAGQGRLRWGTVSGAARFLFSILKRVPASLHAPEAARARLERELEDYLAAARLEIDPNPYQRVADVVAFLRQYPANAFPHVVPRFAATLGPALASLALLHRLAGERRDLALEITRGLPHNVTTEMDLALVETAKRIRADPAAHEIFTATTADELSRRYLDHSLPEGAQTAVHDFLQRYGMRGVAEIDFGQVRWREAPQPVFHSLQSYLSLPDEAGPDVVFARGAVAAEAAIESLVASVRAKPLGGLRAVLVRAAARRVRALAGVRESPKFFLIRLFGIARAALLSAGVELTATGVLSAVDDLVFLTVDELAALAARTDRDWRPVIADRRQAREHEHRRRQVPRLLLGDGRAFYEGLGAEAAEGGLHGSPVSPGVVEGVVHIVLDPRGVQLTPGEILVCPGTDPAWTPLFMAAGGLITEVGGMMTHGSVVAREYGIPAVVGVHAATTRLHTGQRIRLDGSTGQIVSLD